MTCFLTLPDQKTALAAIDRCGGSSCQGEILDALAKTPMAKAERSENGPTRAMDHVHLTRYDGTDYVRWIGRCSDGYHRPFGRVMQIVAAPEELEYGKTITQYVHGEASEAETFSQDREG